MVHVPAYIPPDNAPPGEVAASLCMCLPTSQQTWHHALLHVGQGLAGKKSHACIVSS
jgi:hypothetical protein